MTPEQNLISDRVINHAELHTATAPPDDSGPLLFTPLVAVLGESVIRAPPASWAFTRGDAACESFLADLPPRPTPPAPSLLITRTTPLPPADVQEVLYFDRATHYAAEITIHSFAPWLRKDANPHIPWGPRKRKGTFELAEGDGPPPREPLLSRLAKRVCRRDPADPARSDRAKFSAAAKLARDRQRGAFPYALARSADRLPPPRGCRAPPGATPLDRKRLRGARGAALGHRSVRWDDAGATTHRWHETRGEPTGVYTWSDFNLRGQYRDTLNDRGFMFELPVEEVGAGEVVHGVNPPLMRIAAENVMEVAAGERERWAYPTQRTRRRPRDLAGTRAERINREIERKRIKRDRKRWLSRWFRKDR
ncbi:hypothetical protein EDC01DRAFT_626550 [Geopyxis carbonaria]|nr:hypothetical protein EDC01DRAFT_626550 [Geopyxis carbonaria]